MSETRTVVKLENVTKVIKRQTVLNGINLDLTEGKVYGFVGKNASGKTMLFRVICGLVYPTSGRVVVFDKEIFKNGFFPQGIGAMLEQPGFLPQYSGKKNLKLLASIRKLATEEQIESCMKN